MARKRMTWQADKQASLPPATPGYSTEDQDHPAHQNDPEMHDYENGDTSEWAEDVYDGPYVQSDPPADPGYGTEDQDHPAHKSLTAAVREKAANCLKLAELQLKAYNKNATRSQIEDHAMDLMELGNTHIDRMLNRFSSDFLSDDVFDADDLDDLLAEDADDLDDLLAEDADELALEAPVLDDDDDRMDTILASIQALSNEVKSLKSAADDSSEDSEDSDDSSEEDESKKKADQNDPKGETLDPKSKTEDEARKEAANDPLFAEFDSYDVGKTGFVSVDEWQGSKAVFAALDTDKDGIIARVDLEASFNACGEEIADELAPEDLGTLAEMSLEDDVVEEPIAELMDEDPMEIIEDPAIEDSDPDSDADMFEMSYDPMGLSDEGTILSSDDDALLNEVFGGKTAKKSDEEVEDIEEVESKANESDEEVVEEETEEVESKKKAKKSDEEDTEEDTEEVESKKKASQRPQPRKASNGVKQVGTLSKVAKKEVDELRQLWDSEPDVSKVFE